MISSSFFGHLTQDAKVAGADGATGAETFIEYAAQTAAHIDQTGAHITK